MKNKKVNGTVGKIQEKVRKEKVSQLASTEIGREILTGKTMEEIAEMDADDIISAQVHELEKRKKEYLELSAMVSAGKLCCMSQIIEVRDTNIDDELPLEAPLTSTE